jgi:hypothetical protein
MTGSADWPTLLLLIAAFWIGAGIGYQAGRRARQLDDLDGKKDCEKE